MKKYLIILLIFGNINLFAQFGFGGGDGTQANPYQIETKAHLEELNDSIDYGNSWSQGKYFILMNDITDTVRTMIGANSYVVRAFCGNFDGQGFKIVLGINEQIHNRYSVGLFAVIKHGTISNLTVEGYVISSRATYIGGIAGEGEDVVIKNCVNNCTVTTINNLDVIGGIIGCGYNCKIENCINNGNIINNNKIFAINSGSGGIIGSAGINIQIENCINNGNIQALYCAGGIVGSFSTFEERDNLLFYIRNCINYGFVQGELFVGGIAGLIGSPYDADKIDVPVSNCINTGVITGKLETGCIVGYKGSRVTVENCHFDKQMCEE